MTETLSSFITEFTQSAYLAEFESGRDEHDFISLLALIQKLRIPILPITWQSAAGPLGEGGQASVNQSLINVQTSFAFKCFRNTSGTDQRVPFQAIISELTMHSLPAIKDHLLVIDLVGVCWDIQEDDLVWPVLVYTKAHRGDLYHFARSGRGLQLSIAERLDLCVHIFVTLSDMHTNNIIHGDIKPHNILVFDYQDEEGNFFEGEYYAKVADFGFSAWSRAGNDLVFFPESRPWNAPEYHHRGFSIDQAKRMDIYSFGLVCLWLLFGAKRDLDMAPPVDLLGACERPLNFDIHGHQQTTLEAWKKSDNGILMRWIRWLMEEHVDSDPKLKDRLIQIFQLTLAFDPEDRTNNYRLLRELLSPTLGDVPEPAVFEIMPELVEEGHFEIADYLAVFYESDFRLRRYIAQELERIATDANRHTYSRTSILNAQKLLAFCYSIGFGVPKDDRVSAKWLEALPSGQEENSEAISRLRGAAPIYHRDPRQADLWNSGHLRVLDFVSYYQEKGLSSRAEEIYKREIADLEAVLGQTHWLPQTLRHRLSLILLGQERWKEAEEILRALLLLQEELLGPKHPRTFFTALALTHTYRNPERWWDAVSICQDLIKQGENIWGMEHPTMIELAAELVDRGKQLAIAHEEQEPGNPTVQRLLPLILEKTEVIETSILAMASGIWGKDHPTTLHSMNNLVQTYTLRGRYEDAKTLGLEVLCKCKETLPPGHAHICIATVQLVDVEVREGRLRLAELLILELLETVDMLGAWKSLYIRMAMVRLAMIYRDQGHLAMAERLMLRVMKTELQMESFDKHVMLGRMQTLAQLMRAQAHEKDVRRVEDCITEMSVAINKGSHVAALIIIEEELWGFQSQRPPFQEHDGDKKDEVGSMTSSVTSSTYRSDPEGSFHTLLDSLTNMYVA